MDSMPFGTSFFGLDEEDGSEIIINMYILHQNGVD
jgi:hypothetical protein